IGFVDETPRISVKMMPLTDDTKRLNPTSPTWDRGCPARNQPDSAIEWDCSHAPERRDVSWNQNHLLPPLTLRATHQARNSVVHQFELWEGLYAPTCRGINPLPQLQTRAA